MVTPTLLCGIQLALGRAITKNQYDDGVHRTEGYRGREGRSVMNRSKGQNTEGRMVRATYESKPAKMRTAWHSGISRPVVALFNGLMSYLIINLTSLIAFVLFRVFTRTRVYGRANIGLAKNTLICANHRTMIDSYLVGHLSSWPWGWLFPHVLPYHPAAVENFFKNPILAWFSNRWRCVPVRRGIRDFGALKIMTETLPKGQMLIFPEGSRSRTGDLLPGRPGTGKLIHDSQCKVVPIYVSGMSDILPIGSRWPRFFRRLDVHVGTPVPLDDLLQQPESLETSKAIVGRVMEHIAELKKTCESRSPSVWQTAVARGRRALGF
jgi:1-acyl-sn-glycerol-3-phosphate acyltransferase